MRANINRLFNTKPSAPRPTLGELGLTILWVFITLLRYSINIAAIVILIYTLLNR